MARVLPPNDVVFARSRSGVQWPFLKACAAEGVLVSPPIAAYSLIRVSAAASGTQPIADTPISDRIFNLLMREGGTSVDSVSETESIARLEEEQQKQQQADPKQQHTNARDNSQNDRASIRAMKESLSAHGFMPLADVNHRPRPLPHLRPFHEELIFSKNFTVTSRQRQVAIKHMSAEFEDLFNQRRYKAMGGHSERPCTDSRSPCELHKLRRVLVQAEEDDKKAAIKITTIDLDEYGLPLRNKPWVKKTIPSANARETGKHEPKCRMSHGADSRRVGVHCICKALRKSKMNNVNGMIDEFTARVHGSSCDTPRPTSVKSQSDEPSVDELVALATSDVRPADRPGRPINSRLSVLTTTTTTEHQEGTASESIVPLLSPKETQIVFKPRTQSNSFARLRTMKLSPLPSDATMVGS